jgi:hypothetical protein
MAATAFGATVTPITNVTTATSTIGNTTVNGTVFQGYTRAVTEMSDSAGNIYTPAAMGTDAFVRRNTWVGNSNNSSVTFASSTGGSFLSSYAMDMKTVLLSNNIYRSADNIFANGNNVDTGNIERVDFLFNGTVGVTATSLSNIAVFERGLAGAHDSFNITLITGWNSNTSTPTSFTTITTVSMLDFGPNNVTVDGTANYNYNYNLFRYNTGDNLSNWNANNQTGNQGIGAVILNFLDMGATSGQTIYGYSLSANDTTTNPSRYANWNNTSRFPDNSTNGFDPYGINGFIWDKKPPIPEPETYGLIFMGSLLSFFFGWRKWKAKKV